MASGRLLQPAGQRITPLSTMVHFSLEHELMKEGEEVWSPGLVRTPIVCRGHIPIWKMLNHILAASGVGISVYEVCAGHMKLIVADVLQNAGLLVSDQIPLFGQDLLDQGNNRPMTVPVPDQDVR